MPNNCKFCKHLEFHDDDTDGMMGPNSGYTCEKRIGVSDKADCVLLKKMESDAYLMRSKRCFEAKGGAA